MPGNPVQVLLIEDDEAHAEAVRRAFFQKRPNAQLNWVTSIGEARASLNASRPDVVVADWLLPDGKGTDILPPDRETVLFPVILMTSYGNEQVAVEAMKAGVVDYVVKSSATFSEMPHIAERALQQWCLAVDHKRAQEALRQSEQRFRTIFQEVRDAIYLKDRSLRFVDVNAAVEKLVGLPASQIKGLRFEDIFGREGLQHVREIERRVLRGETIEEEDTRVIHGIPMTFIDTRVPLRNGDGEIVGILGISHNITDRKRLEPTVQPPGAYRSKAMREAMEEAKVAAKKASIILLTGESGAGKDYLAKYIHDHSDRSTGLYFAVNCAAIAPQLAESELFGHERGAFTGAAGRKRGLLELAEGGTLLLNEIGELPPMLQSKLLTFLDTKKFTRVGGEREVSVSARLIAATNRDLEKEVEAGRFRKDLFFRINVMSIRVPPLRERIADIPVLVQEVLERIKVDLHLHEVPDIDSKTMNALQKYHWPGNVRELRNVLERGVILSGGTRVDLSGVALQHRDDTSSEDESTTLTFSSDSTLQQAFDRISREFCMQALRHSGGNKKTAAERLGISRDTLYRYLQKFGISDSE